MAVTFNGRNGRRHHKRVRPMSEINVTPFVDVMLVLLIVFMVTAPLLTMGVPVDLPQTKAQQLNEPKDPLVISINAECKTYLQNSEIDQDALVPRLQAITNNNPSATIYVRGDRNANYGCVLGVMGLVNGAGFSKVSLISEQPKGNPSRQR